MIIIDSSWRFVGGAWTLHGALMVDLTVHGPWGPFQLENEEEEEEAEEKEL